MFIGGSGADLRRFPHDARQRAGYQLHLVQRGLDSSDWKPMTTVGPRCQEIRIHTGAGAYRVIYVATIGDAVYVLHCFAKKTQRTTKADIDLANRRYQEATEMIRAEERS